MGQHQAYCCICGAPTLPSGIRWLQDVVLLTTTTHQQGSVRVLDIYEPKSCYALESASSPLRIRPTSNPKALREVIALTATYDYGPWFDLQSGDRVKALYMGGDRATTRTIPGSHLYLPVHKVCLKISGDFINTVALSPTVAEPGSITSMYSLWEVLYHRMPGRVNTYNGVLAEPHRYYGAERSRGVEWEPRDDEAGAKLFEAYPSSGIRELNSPTTSSYANTQPCRNEASPQVAEQAYLNIVESDEQVLSRTNYERIMRILRQARVGDVYP